MNPIEERKIIERIVIDFKGVQIFLFEADILQKLENQSDKQFNLVDKVEGTTEMGFTVENQRISAIGLFRCGLTTLPKSIGKLKSLNKLNLEDNYLISLPEGIKNLEEIGVRILK